VSKRFYPVQPLLQMMGCTLSEAQKTLGIGGDQYRRFQEEGLRREVAERKALKAGFHPYEVWPELADDDYDTTYRAKERRYQRNWYRNASPEVKARLLESARRYKRSSARAISLYNRRYREQNKERIAARQREHYLANRERILARQREYDRRKREERRQEALQQVGPDQQAVEAA
jgi:hypothetical protein